jgi:DNA invertase Pin-like site-specific DNA recombinase/DNA-binding transcriptional MerR regulator
MNAAKPMPAASTSLPTAGATPAAERSVSPSIKVKTHHLARKAIVYVRQSTPQQLLNNVESTQRQYALRQRALQLGWPTQLVSVIDEDQGHSGASAEGRLGFQSLLAQVALNQVGIVLGLETSRLARSNKDWHQLLEVCALFQTLLADQDGVYDPTDYNDRLLLGLKGAMSEAELHLLRNRMYEGLLNKARRGEVYSHPPIGYVKGPTGSFMLDPDQQVQSVVRLLFEQFPRQGSVCALLRYLVQQGIRLPVRPLTGAQKGELEWHPPNRVTLLTLLHHPIYAGYYRWGHRAVDPRKKVPGRRQSGRTLRAPADCLVLLPNHCPAYISPEQFWANQDRLNENRAGADSRGAPRQGQSLLSGLLVCGHCGYRMATNYNSAGWGLRYCCAHASVLYGEPECQSLSGRRLDEFIGTQVLAALEPAALELHLAAVADVEQQRQQLHQHWQQQRERARYATERAARQYQRVEPEHRLVAGELERRWEEAMQEQSRLEREYEEFCVRQPVTLSAAERAQIRALSQEIPALWGASSTTAADRQRVVRLLIEQIEVAVQGQSEQVKLVITWSGGSRSEHGLVRTVQRYEQLSVYPQLCQRIEALRAAGQSLAEVAACLNAEGFHPPKQVERFTGQMVAGFLARKYAKEGQRVGRGRPTELRPGEWLLGDLARHLGMPATTLHHWRKLGWVRARKLSVAGGLWAMEATGEERKRLARLRRYQTKKPNQPIPRELTSPPAKQKK